MAEMLFGDYTTSLKEQLNMQATDSADYDYDNIREFMNSNEFRSFSDRLLAFYNEKNQSTFSPDEAKKDFLSKCNQHNIPFNRNTADNWFKSGNSPKFGDSDRENMFKLAFALDLPLAEVYTLFNKVYLDKGFNLRNPHELVYYYCFANSKPYSAAVTIITALNAKMPEKAETTDETIGTQKISDYVWGTDDDSLIDFIIENPHNFSLNNTTAKKKLDELTKDIRGTKEKEGFAAREFRSYFDIEGRATDSIDFMLDTIRDQDLSKHSDAENSIKELFRAEVSNQFPDKHSFEPSVKSSYVLRKSLILVYFYWYWIQDFFRGATHKTGSYEDFYYSLNDILDECGYSLLYPGNPYDWLFLYCSACKEQEIPPLDVFREIIQEE